MMFASYFLFLAGFIVHVDAYVNLASVFVGDHAVLQENEIVSIWGNSSGASVVVSIDAHEVSHADVDADGNWKSYLPPHATSWGTTLTVKNSVGEVTKATVKYGQVLLCSGQSNMGMPVHNWSVGGFSAANGTAEVAAAGRYSNKISLLSVATPFPRPSAPVWNGSGSCGWPAGSNPDCKPYPQWNMVSPGVNGTLHGFSAVCWYSGKFLFDYLGEKVPVGLMTGSVGGSPIEFWLPEGHVNNSICGIDNPPCDHNKNISDSQFFNGLIKPFVPYTVNTVVWDQGERDVHCFAPATNHTARYPCLEKELVKSWRQEFNSSFAFVGVQLPGYIGDCDAPGANPNSSYYNCVPGVYNMRLAQDEGVQGDNMATVTATYDLSCPFGITSPECPFGSVHNVFKVEIGKRIAKQIMRLHDLQPNLITTGPRAIRSTFFQKQGNEYNINVEFSLNNGDDSLHLEGTQFCAECCRQGSVGDFDISVDNGKTFVNGTLQGITGKGTMSFSAILNHDPTHVRYTANQGFPQCAVYNSYGFPAYPFILPVTP
eukprot:m.72340 g.72340  ORF g.72340 m.72340 type:complete len:542 (-) comp12317_c0_seq1:86-1711(-)